jgi:hypothetical protein
MKRCQSLSLKGHPRIRLTEADLDAQVLALFAKLRIDDAEVRSWVLRVLRARIREEQDYTREQRAELHRQLTLIQGRQTSFSTSGCWKRSNPIRLRRRTPSYGIVPHGSSCKPTPSTVGMTKTPT